MQLFLQQADTYAYKKLTWHSFIVQHLFIQREDQREANFIWQIWDVNATLNMHTISTLYYYCCHFDQ